MVLGFLSLLVGVAVVGTASGAHYGDYTAAKMPVYGSEEYHESAREIAPAIDDYHDRSPEVPASPDYKYEEHLNLRTVDTRTEENRRKPTKKTPRLERLNVEPLKKYNSVKAKPKFVSAFRRHPKTRYSSRNTDLNKNSLRTGRIRSNDFIDKEDEFLSEDRYHYRFNDNNVNARGTSTERVIRRKPRDRSPTSPETEGDELDEEDDEENKSERDDAKDGDYSVTEESVALEERTGESMKLETNEENEEIQHRSHLRSDDDIVARLEAKKLDQKKEEYQDYYDMKRVNYIKKRITVLYRRTKARATGTTTSRRYQVWTYRRSFVLDRYATTTGNDEDSPTRTTARIKTKTKKKNKTKTRTKPTRKIAMIAIHPTTTKRTTSHSTTATVFITSSESYQDVTTDLSLAEKSRLSILKKAQLKESLMDKILTDKPPVLMQVSQRMNTMVMVEPPKQNGNMQLMGSLESQISDSPHRLARAKRLMRRKLVAGARSIHDLTENWDEMICDYLDISQLDAVRKNNAEICLILTLSLILQFL